MSEDPSSKLTLLKSRPLCIICARPSEATQIAERLQCINNRLTGAEMEEIHDDHVFYLGTFEGNGKKLEYYITSSLKQGMQSFATCASTLFHVLRPQYAIHAGVCAAFSASDASGQAGTSGKDIGLTHVIFGEKAINYEEGKWEIRDGKHFFLPDYDTTSCPTGDLQSWASSGDRPNYHYGDYITGSAVRGDANAIFERIRREVDRNAVALDMEASVFLQLCQHLKVRSLGVIKGVSDFGDSNKGRDPRIYDTALQRTARALELWVQHRQPNLVITVDIASQPGSLLSIGFYNNFIKSTLDALCHSQYPARYVADNSQIHRDEIKGIKVVMPQGNRADFYAEPRHVFALKRDYGLPEVRVGEEHMMRTFQYKAGYLIDFPRNLNTLVHHRGASDQVKYFFEALSRQPYFASRDGAREPQAQSVPWTDFVLWLDHEKDIETRIALESGRQMRAMSSPSTSVVGPATENGSNNPTTERSNSVSWWQWSRRGS